jgi:hypothetical protein
MINQAEKTKSTNGWLHKPIYPFLLVLFFVVNGYRINYGLVPLTDTVQIAITYLLAAVVLVSLGFWAWRSWQKAALMSFALLCMEFFFGAAHDWLRNVFGEILLTRYSFLLPLIFLTIVLLLFAISRSKKSFNGLGKYLNFLLLTVLVLEIVQAVFVQPRPLVVKNKFTVSPCKSNSCMHPDIYLIVADEYAGLQQLRDILHFDNRPFEDSLRARGFYVVANARSNYNLTEYSIASMLNASYLDASPKTNAKDVARCMKSIDQSSVITSFVKMGYEFHNLSVFNVQKQPAFATHVFPEFSKKLITGQTFTKRIWRDIGYHLVTEGIWRGPKPDYFVYYRNTQQQLAETRRLLHVTSSKPRFIYTHLDMPHSPFYFDKDGNPNPASRLSYRDKTNKSLYVGYLQYANKQFLKLLDEIRAQSKEPPIILFMGDHGFRGFDDRLPQSYYMMTMNAIYLPSGNYEKWYTGMTHINQLPLLLNTEFGQQIPLQKDSSTFIGN